MPSYNANFGANDNTINVTFGNVQRIVSGNDYNELSNKPSIENVVLEGNKTFKQLGIEPMSVTEIEKILYLNT